MTEKVQTKADLAKENEELREENEALANGQALMEQRVAKMEALIQQQIEADEYKGPEPVVYHDPFDCGVNPHHIKKHPDGKILSWKNPNIRNGTRGWRGWVPITYDSEYGERLHEFITDPPAKMEGSADQDNYVRRGTDSILCYIDEEIFYARQQKRETKALRKQLAAQAVRNRVLGPGVETFGDGVQVEPSPPGGFKAGQRPSPLTSEHPSHRTEMFDQEE